MFYTYVIESFFLVLLYYLAMLFYRDVKSFVVDGKLQILPSVRKNGILVMRLTKLLEVAADIVSISG